MKIKSDFVTNSSSTSFIVYIPDDFVVKEEHITDNLMMYDFGELLKYNDGDMDKCIKGLNDGIYELKRGGKIWCDFFDIQEHYEAFHALHEILGDQNFVLEQYESNADNGKIHNVSIHSQKIIEIISAEHLSKMEVKGADDDHTEDEE